MKLIVEGEKSMRECSNCNSIVPTTFKYADVPFSDGVGMATNILVGVCDCCGQVVSTPPQSTPAIRQSRAKALHSVEVKVPLALVDAVNMAAFEIDVDFSQEFRKKAIWYFVRWYATEKPDSFISAKSQHIADIEKLGQPRGRFSFKVSKAMSDDLKKACEALGENQTETIKIAAITFYKKIVENPDRKIVKKMKDLAYMA